MNGSAETKRGEEIFFIRRSLHVLPAIVAPPSAARVGGLAVNHAGCCLTLWGVAVLPLLRLSFMSSAVVDEKN